MTETTEIGHLASDFNPIVRWPDPPDVGAELTAAVLAASPRVCRLALAVVAELADRAASLDRFSDALATVAVHAGQHGEPELAGLLLAIDDAIRASEVFRRA